MRVLKFGGTSVADAERIRAVTQIVRGRARLGPVAVVVSAQGGVTNQLIELAHQAVETKIARAAPLPKRYRELLAALDLPQDLVDEDLDELRSLLQGIKLVGDLSPRSLDRMMSFGERCSARIIAAAFRSAGLPAQAAMSYEHGLVTDDAYGEASVAEATIAELGQELRPLLDDGRLPVITGFIGRDAEGYITTLGRGGSDYSAALVGSALGAEAIEIWTDVNGVMSADPRIVPAADRLARMSFEEAAELAYYGARVLHPATIQPAVERDIPIRVLNTYAPDESGTEIVRDPTGLPPGPRSIASKKRITLVHVTSLRMLLQHGFMAALFRVFEEHGVVIDVISTSEVSVSLTTDDSGRLDGVVAALGEFADVRVEPDKAIVCLVGEGLRNDESVLERTFRTLRVASISPRMVSVGASRINVSLVVDQDKEAAAVRALHHEFFEL